MCVELLFPQNVKTWTWLFVRVFFFAESTLVVLHDIAGHVHCVFMGN